ncbi:MAG: hypothetical protein AB1489_09095 [Acidobacteriota bacterium]
MASYRDPTISFTPIEVVERLLEICEYCGQPTRLYLSSSLDLATYLDSFGFDVYSLTTNTKTAFKINRPTTMVLPSGDRTHSHCLAH